MMKLVLIAGGGAIGSVLRYLMSTLVQRASNLGSFPVGTLTVNILGCFVLGLLATLITGAGPFAVREEYRLGILVGLLGGFTTFSTFGLESVNLISAGQYRISLLNIVLSNILGLLAAWGGNRLAVGLWMP